jgi:hypothetical protein
MRAHTHRGEREREREERRGEERRAHKSTKSKTITQMLKNNKVKKMTR